MKHQWIQSQENFLCRKCQYTVKQDKEITGSDSWHDPLKRTIYIAGTPSLTLAQEAARTWKICCK